MCLLIHEKLQLILTSFAELKTYLQKQVLTNLQKNFTL